MILLRVIIVAVLALPVVGFGQTTQPATQPSTQPADAAVDRSTPAGECQYFDKHIADIGIDGGMAFYHCINAAQRRYARSELEWYVALNKLVRVIGEKFGADDAREVRHSLGDVDDYSNTKVDVEGDAAAMQHPDAEPYPLIRVDGRWKFSMPDWFEMKGTDPLQGVRMYMESTADKLDTVRERLTQGRLTTLDAVKEALKEVQPGQE